MNIKTAVIRRSPVLLAIRLFWLEVLVAIIYGFWGTFISLFVGDNWLRFSVFLLFTIGEMMAVLWLSLRWAGEQYLIGEEELVHRQGVLQIVEESFSLKNVQAVGLSQSVWGRLFNYGTVKFFSPVLKQEYVLSEVPDPEKVKTMIEKSTGGFSSQESDARKELIIPIRNTK